MTRRLILQSIDDYLGPASGRFFGAGYRRSQYSFGAPVVTDEAFRSTVDIRYPVDWSKKREGDDLRPHLSTVDVMVLAARCAETLLERRFGLSEAELGDARIRKTLIRAGTEPQEDLDGVPLTARITRSVPREDGDGLVSTFETRVGVMMARLQVEHRAGSGAPEAGDDWSTLTGRDDRYWGTGFRREDQLVENVNAELDELRCHADVKLLREERTAGLGSTHAPVVTLIDGFVTLLQLGQVLLYELDGLDRSNSDTLWMQQVVLRQGEPPSAEGNDGTASLTVSDHQLLTMPDGRWRNAELRGQMGGVSMTAAFAHRIARTDED
ncbi:AvrD family protein [Nocardiopsis sp. FIRDI 009]|uniref:AvrD family protein n=1 Tax=Nocardiopsis sp. FIRDI 009 TaxID=714197 RepID=UPI0013002531|nr:AvrD family protein [Nocardiopsis sp. FIRDI 009]